MSDIKQKFDPSTHATRCGKQWRWLEVEGLSNLIAVDNGRREYLMFVDHNGYAGAAIGEPESIDRFDLIPITHKPVDLPTNIREEIRYALMIDRVEWCGYNVNPRNLGNQPLRYWNLDCFEIPPDPAGEKNSLHVRTKDGWERVQ